MINLKKKPRVHVSFEPEGGAHARKRRSSAHKHLKAPRAFYTNLLDTFASKHSIETQEQWYTTPLHSLQKQLPQFREKHSLRLLKRAYPQFEWFQWKFVNQQIPVGYWDNVNNQREFFEWLGEKLGVRSYEDWYKFTHSDIARESSRAVSLLTNKHQDSLARALAYVFPEFDWKPWLFKIAPHHYFQDVTTHRRYLDWFADENNFESYANWYMLTQKDVRKLGIRSVQRLYRDSLWNMLSSVFPEVNWYPWLFERLPKNYWNDPSNVRAYLEWMESKLGMSTRDDWYRVTTAQLHQMGGGRLIFKRTLYQLLAQHMPHHEWDEQKFDSLKVQQYLLSIIQGIFPQCRDIQSNYSLAAVGNTLALSAADYSVNYPQNPHEISFNSFWRRATVQKLKKGLQLFK